MFARLISTPIGPLYAEAGVKGIIQIQLLVLAQGYRENPSPLLDELANRIKAYFDGEHESFRKIKLDYSGMPAKRVALYERVRRIPYGKTRSYGDLAHELLLSARAVGAGMRACPFFPVVPAQRVIHADGRIGGFGGAEGIKEWLLRFEGAI